MIESLESRKLMSVDLTSGGTLVVTGVGGNDSIVTLFASGDDPIDVRRRRTINGLGNFSGIEVFSGNFASSNNG